MKIKCAAIKRSDGVVVEGRDHGECVLKSPDGTCESGKSIQGFVTDTGKFVDRKEAGRIAFEAGQIDKPRDFCSPRILLAIGLGRNQRKWKYDPLSKINVHNRQ